METLSLRHYLKFRQAQWRGRANKNNPNKTFKISAVSAGLVLLFGIAMFSFNSPTVLKTRADSTPVVASANISSSTIPLILGINIANNGLVFVRGARITAISGDAITTSMSWGSASFSWVIKTSGSTKFINQQGQKQTISNLKVGDAVTVTGKLVGDSGQFTINAEFVRG